MLCCVSWQIVTDITQDNIVSVFKVKQSCLSENTLNPADEDTVIV